MRLIIGHLGLVGSLFLISPAIAAPGQSCSRIFEIKTLKAKPLVIEDLLDQGTTSKLTDNFKLQWVTLFQAAENYYGPLGLKSSTVGLNWSAMKTMALRAANSTSQIRDQYYAVADFFAQLNDGHVSVSLPSSLVYRLPIQLVSAEGRYFSNALFDSFPKDLRRPDKGDEIVAIDGVSPAEFQKRHAHWNAQGNDLTNQAIFSMTFGFWSEEGGLPLARINQDSIRMKLKSGKDGSLYEINLPFRKMGLGLIGKEPGSTPSNLRHPKASPKAAEGPKILLARAPKTSSVFKKFHALFNVQKPAPKMTNGPFLGAKENRPMRIGETNPFFDLPADFKKIDVPENTPAGQMLKNIVVTQDLLAGTFQRHGKTVGFLRIPSYGPEDLGGTVLGLRYLISQLEKTTDYLVIDQTNNPGGAVVYSDLVVKALAGDWNPATHMEFAVKPTQKFLRQYAEMREEIAKNEEGLYSPAAMVELLTQMDREYSKIHTAYQEGRALSEPVSLLPFSDGFERALAQSLSVSENGGPSIGDMIAGVLGGIDLRQNQVYTKKVYMLINELDFSGGDATPAILQDYKRVTLIGNRTAGAGGTVENFSFQGHLDIDLSLTTSLMVRKDGRLVENYGVQPDVLLPLTGSDVRDGYSSYFERVMTAIDQQNKRRR